MSPADSAATDADVVLAELSLTRSLTIQLTAIGTLGMVVGWAAFAGLFQAVTGEPVSYQFLTGVGWWTDALNVLVIVVLGTVFVVPHEWLHGLAIRYYGGEPRYGVGVAHFILPYAYATTDHEFTRNQFVVVLLTPLVVMTAVGTPLMLLTGWGWLVIPLALNAAGAVVDVWMTMTVLSYPPAVRFEDHETGVRILGPESARRTGPSATALVWDALGGAAVATFGTLVLLAIAGPLTLSVLGVESLTLGRPGTITHLFTFTETPEEISFSVGPGVLVVGAVAGLAYALARSYLRNGE